MAEFNRRFQVPATQSRTAFLPFNGQDLDRIFSLHHERVVNRDNTVQFENRALQIERVRWSATLFGCTVRVHQHLNGDLTLTHGQQTVASYPAQTHRRSTQQWPWKRRVLEKSKCRLSQHTWNSHTTRDSHSPTATTAAG